MCKTPNGMKTYVFKVGCLGLVGMPASSLPSVDESVIYGIDGCRVYLDDISYATVTIEEHLVLLRKCFQGFREKKVFLHPQAEV